MILKKLGVLLFLMLFGCYFTAEAKQFDAEEFFLDNGLHVVVIKNHKAPIVKQMLFYKVGATDELPGKGGIAHLLEHLMFRGTKRVKGQEFNRIAEQNGMESNAFTSQDVTAYHQFVDVSRLELAMFLEADRMQNLAINENDFITERDIVFQERKQRVDNSPVAKFFETVNKTLWQEHPYANPVTGYDTEILNLTPKDAIDFYKRYYVPNNAVLVLSGDIDVETAKKMADKYYGKLKPMEKIQTKFELKKGMYKAKAEMSTSDVKMERFVKMFVAPSFVQNKKQAYALEILAEYMGGNENSPLYQKMVVRDKTALNISVYYDGIARSYGKFVISAIPVSDNTDVFEKKIDRAWNDALKNFDENDLKEIKQRLKINLIYLKDNPESLAQTVGWMLAVGMNLDDLQQYVEEVDKITLSDVFGVADYLWNEAHQAIGVLHPEEIKQ